MRRRGRQRLERFASAVQWRYAPLMARGLVIAWLSLLLIGMQQQLVVHELEHIRARLECSNEVIAQAPQDTPCVQCSLLSGGANVVPIHDAVPVLRAHTADHVSIAADTWPAKASPASYRSRAPPTFV